MATRLLALTAATAASAEIFGQSNAVPDGSFFIQIKEEYIQSMTADSFLQRMHDETGDRLKGSSLRVSREFNIGKNFKAFKVDGLPEEEALRMSENAAHIKAVSANQIFKIYDQPAQDPMCDDNSSRSWGISRTQTMEPGSAADGYTVASDECGEGVTLYIIDSGIYTEHNSLDGRAIKGHNGVGNEPDEDFIGHGTHVASTAMGLGYGLARCARAESVKVCDFYGNCSLESLLSGMNYVAEQAATSDRKSVANMSLGGNRNPVFNEGAEGMVQAGALVVAAAGNERIDACNISPASAEGVYTVMASDSRDRFSSFSNMGPCCDISAPGDLIPGAWANRGPDGESLQTGTSMSSPHVAGVMAKYWSANLELSAPDVIRAVDSMALTGVVSDTPSNSPNKLLHMPSGCDNVTAKQ